MLTLACFVYVFVLPYLSKKKGIREIGLTPSGLAELVSLIKERKISGRIAKDDVMKANADKVEQFRSGKTKLQGFFVGQAVALSGGKADP
ncbi:unnamed protein product, partial [Ectocarpus fasciculatus]